jgi:N-formylglutamate amidohydrolase
MEIPGIYSVTDPAGPAAPLLLGVPHSGRVYPGDFRYACPLEMLRQTEDSFVDELVVDAAQHGATILAALFPRAMVDVNRALSDLDPAIVDGVWPEPLQPTVRTLQGLGLIRRLCKGGVPMYDAPLSLAEIDQRLRQFYHPYHHALTAQLNGLKRRFDEVWLIDCHSMPSSGYEGDGTNRRADFVLGDRDGTTCDPEFTALVVRLLRDMGYSVAINDPYKGIEILQRYGQPARRQHALQLEINRALYLDEPTCARSANFDRLRGDMATFFNRVVAALSRRHDVRLAAE